MKKHNFLQWLPGILGETAAVIFCIIYALTDGSTLTMHIELPGTALLGFLIPVYNKISGKSLPTVLSAACSIFVFMAVCLGTAMDFYHKIWFWDLIMHGLSGFLSGLIIFVFIINWNGSRLNPIGCMIVIFGFCMGIAAIWEVVEFTTDSLFGGDAQRVQESLATGKSPISDTMEDIIAAMVGNIIFLLSVFIDKLNNYTLLSKLCGFTGFDGGRHVNICGKQTGNSI